MPQGDTTLGQIEVGEFFKAQTVAKNVATMEKIEPIPAKEVPDNRPLYRFAGEDRNPTIFNTRCKFGGRYEYHSLPAGFPVTPLPKQRVAAGGR